VIDYYHNIESPRSAPPCHKLAFSTGKEIVYGQLMVARDFTLPDGTHPSPNTQIVCGSCRQLIPFESLVAVKNP